MPNRLLKLLAIAVILLDAGISLYQHSLQALEGDIVAIVLPAEAYKPVLEDPFGFNAIKDGVPHAGSNRYFAHATMSAYFYSAPLLLQYFTDPIQSVYLSAGLAKLIAQLILLFGLAAYIRKTFGTSLWLAALLLVPLFQTFGYYQQMGIIDRSITYAWFYALPVGLQLWWFYPFYREKEFRFSPALIGILGIGAIVLALWSPLGAPLFLLICLTSVGLYAWNHKGLKSVPRTLIILFSLAIVCGLYSLYLGSLNTESMGVEISLMERYGRLPEGLFGFLTNKLAIPLLLISGLVQTAILYRRSDSHKKLRIRNTLFVLVGLALAYILLLPLGGYRVYRPEIVRRDTLLPIILSIGFGYGLSVFALMQCLKGRNLVVLIFYSSLVWLVFWIADFEFPPLNACEREAIEQVQRSKDETVALDSGCPVISWEPVREPEQTRVNGEMLTHWGILENPKRYYSVGTKK